MAAPSSSFASDGPEDEPARIHAEQARVERSGLRSLDAIEATVDQSAIQRLSATNATLDRSAAGFVTADHTTIRQSAAGIVVTKSAACDQVRTGILISPVVRGDVHTWLDMRTAVAIGFGFLLGKLVLDIVRGSIRRLL